jgi:hypothetical protein
LKGNEIRPLVAKRRNLSQSEAEFLSICHRGLLAERARDSNLALQNLDLAGVWIDAADGNFRLGF